MDIRESFAWQGLSYEQQEEIALLLIGYMELNNIQSLDFKASIDQDIRLQNVSGTYRT